MKIEEVRKLRGRYRAANADYAVAQESWEKRINRECPEYLRVCALEEKRNRAHAVYVKAFGELPLQQRIKLSGA